MLKSHPRVQIVQCDTCNNVIKVWDGMDGPAKEYGFTRCALRYACIGQRKNLAGYKWYYQDDFKKMFN